MKSLQSNLAGIRSVRSKRLSQNNANLREGGYIMKARIFVQFALGFTLILIVLTACSGGVESNFSVSSDGFNFPAGEPKLFAEETLTTELPLLNQSRVRIEGVRGDIEIEGRDDTNTVKVIAQKWVGSNSLEDAELNLNELEILVTDQIDEVLIQTLQPLNSQGREYIVDYHIILPRNLETEVTVINGDVGVLNVQNRLLVDAENGNVFLANITANVIVSLTNGNIDSTMVNPLDGEIRMNVDNGHIDLSLPTTTSAEFSASATNGSIITYNLEFEATVQTSQSLTGTLGLGEGVIDLGSNNGNISVVGLD